MITVLSKIFVGVASKFFYAFFTERIISKLVLEILRRLSKKTTNTLDDELVKELSANLKH